MCLSGNICESAVRCRCLCAVLLLLSVFAVSGRVAADEPAEKLLRRTSAVLKGYGSYEVKYAVSMQNRRFEGSYVVSGDRFSLVLEGNQVFSDGKNRYEVNESNREVLIDMIDGSGNNILNNPTRAFDLLDGTFRASVAGRSDGVETVRLVPVKSGDMTVEIAIDTASALPVRLVYEAAGERVAIDIVSVKPLAGVERKMFEFDRRAFAGYEIIDFR